MSSLTIELMTLDSKRQVVQKVRDDLALVEAEYGSEVARVAAQIQSRIDARGDVTGNVTLDKLLLHAIRSRWIDFGGTDAETTISTGHRVVRSFETLGDLVAIHFIQTIPSRRRGGEYSESPRLIHELILGRSAGQKLELIEERISGQVDHMMCVGLIPHFSGWVIAKQEDPVSAKYFAADAEKPLRVTRGDSCAPYIPLAIFKKIDLTSQYGAPHTVSGLTSVQILDNLTIRQMLSGAGQPQIDSTELSLLRIAFDELARHPAL